MGSTERVLLCGRSKTTALILLFLVLLIAGVVLAVVLYFRLATRIGGIITSFEPAQGKRWWEQLK